MLRLKDEDEKYKVEKVKNNQIKINYIRYLVKWLD